MKVFVFPYCMLVTLVFASPYTARLAYGQPTSGDNQSQPATVHTVAVFPFAERGSNVKGMGTQVADLLFADLVARPELLLVEREELERVLDEQELNLSGLVTPHAQTAIGQMTGAKILVTGAVVQVDSTLYLVAKIIGTETSRVLGSSAKGRSNDDLDSLVTELASGIVESISQRGGELVAKPTSREDRIGRLKEALGDSERPSVYIAVSERHVGQPAPVRTAAIDPAVETELTLVCEQLGFEIVHPVRGDPADADVLIRGEGFSEFAVRHGNLISVKARLELQAVDRGSREVIATDRQTTVAVDLAEQIAGKTALQEAAATIAERMLPKIVQQQQDD